MSGGSYNYAYHHVEEAALEITEDGCCSAASPELRRAFKAHLLKVAKALRAVEWNDSGDGDDEETLLILDVLGQAGGVV